MRWRLSVMMFLLYTVPGSFAPVFSRRLDQLGFTPDEIARASATQALAGLVGPIVVGQVADRWLPAERCLALCAAVSAALLWLLAGLSEPWPVFFAALAAWLFVGPTMMLSAAISFGHLRDPEKEYGPVRLWGTVGWVAPAFVLWAWMAAWKSDAAAGMGEALGRLGLPVPAGDLSDCFRLGAVWAVVLGVYALTLPPAPRRLTPTSWLAPLAALKLLRDRSFAVYVAGSVGVCVGLAFASQAMPLLLARLGVPDEWIPPTLTVAQSTEVVTLFALPALLLRLGTRGVMLVGMGSWLAGLTVFAFGGPLPLVVVMLGTWGLMICCYVVAGQVFVNRRARGDVRASAQALLTTVNAVGQLAGNLLAGWIRGLIGGALGPVFAAGAALVAVLLVVFVAGFRGNEREAPPNGS